MNKTQSGKIIPVKAEIFYFSIEYIETILFPLFQQKNHWTRHIKWWLIWKVNYMTRITEEGTLCLAQEGLSNKMGGTVAQNTPSQEDPFSLGYPHASLGAPTGYGLSGSNWGGCHPFPVGPPSRAEAGAGEAAVTGPVAGVKPVTTSSGHGNSESLHCLVHAEIIFTGLQVKCGRYSWRF